MVLRCQLWFWLNIVALIKCQLELHFACPAVADQCLLLILTAAACDLTRHVVTKDGPLLKTNKALLQMVLLSFVPFVHVL